MGKSATLEAMAEEFLSRKPPNPPKPPKVPKPPKPPKPPKAPKPPHAPRPPNPPHASPMYSKGGRIEQATVCIKEGKGNQETFNLTGMSHKTVAKLRRILEEENGAPFLCMCGRPASHQGVCLARKKIVAYNSHHDPANLRTIRIRNLYCCQF